MRVSTLLTILAAINMLVLSGCATLPPTPPQNLHEAIQRGDADVAKGFIEKVGNINARDEFGSIPLCLASIGPSTMGGALLFMLASGTNETPGSVKIVRLLINKGAKVNISCPDNLSPLYKATAGGSVLNEIAKLLIKSGANVNWASPSGDTPLMAAYAIGNIEIANLLIQKGANTSRRNLEGKTAQDFYNTYLEQQERQAAAASEQRRRDKAESREMWGAVATLGTGIAVGNATRNLAPDQQTRMMRSSMKAVDSGDTSELTQTTNQVKAEQAQSHKAKMQAIEAQKERDRAATSDAKRSKQRRDRAEQASNNKFSQEGTIKPYSQSKPHRCVEKSKGSSMDYSEEKARAVALRYARPVEGGMNNIKIISSEVLNCKFDAPWTKCVAETKFEVDSTAPCGGRGPSAGKSK